jgi:hypothetical protein
MIMACKEGYVWSGITGTCVPVKGFDLPTYEKTGEFVSPKSETKPNILTGQSILNPTKTFTKTSPIVQSQDTSAKPVKQDHIYDEIIVIEPGVTSTEALARAIETATETPGTQDVIDITGSKPSSIQPSITINMPATTGAGDTSPIIQPMPTAPSVGDSISDFLGSVGDNLKFGLLLLAGVYLAGKALQGRG